MNWVLFGATGVAISQDPQAAERMLSVLIYMVSFFLPIVPLILVGCKKSAFEAVRKLFWAKISMAASALLGIVVLVVIGLTLPLVQTTTLALVTANTMLIVGLLIMRLAEKTS
ncbi:MAG: hypothetical protein AB7I29_13530 [Geobacter sp.]